MRILTFNLKKELVDKFNINIDNSIKFNNIYIDLPNTGKDNISIYYKKNKIDNYDKIFIRLALTHTEIANVISIYSHYKKLNIVDDYFFTRPLINNKLYQTMLMQLNNIPTPKSVFLNYKTISNNTILYLFKKLSKSMIIKEINSDRGENNYVINTLSEFKNIYNNKKPNHLFLIQEFIPNDFYYRIGVIDNEVKYCIKRLRLDKESHLKSIQTRGSKKVYIDINDLDYRIKELAIKTTKLFNIDFAGIDIIINNITNEPSILEINEAPQFKLGGIEEREFYKYLTKI